MRRLGHVAAALLTNEPGLPVGREKRSWPRRWLGEGNMRRISAWLSLSLCATALLTAIAQSAQNGRLTFLSTQLRPIEEAQTMRNLILKGYRPEVDYVTVRPQQFPVRITAEEQNGTPTVGLV